MRPLRSVLWVLLLAAAFSPARAGDEEKVATQVRGFYQWYLPLLLSDEETTISKKHRKEMSRYVSANRLTKLARVPADSQEGDYFVGSLDADAEWLKNLAVSNVKVAPKGRATAEVRLTGGTAAPVHAKLTLVSEGGAYKIDAMEPLSDHNAMAAAQLRAFYAQYVRFLAHAIGDDKPTNQKTVQNGLTKAGFQKATAKGAVDYLLQSGDWDPAWEEHVEVKQVEITPDGKGGTAEVVLTGTKIPKDHVKVSLKYEENVFKIDGVEKIAD